MDGQLSFFIHDSFAFAVFLPDFLTPGPLCYVKRTDSIVTANSSRHLQSFKYDSVYRSMCREHNCIMLHCRFQSLSIASAGTADSRENTAKIIVVYTTVQYIAHIVH